MKKFIILFPVYNDWKSLWKLCEEIDDQVKDLDANFSLLFVNDASTEKKINFESNLNKINSIKIINMRKNHLSGRCIATGLQYISKKEEFFRSKFLRQNIFNSLSTMIAVGRQSKVVTSLVSKINNNNSMV